MGNWRVIVGVACALAICASAAFANAPIPIFGTAPMPRADRVPASARVVRIVWPSHTLVVRNPSKVARIRRLVNALPVAKHAPECSEGIEIGPPVIRFSFIRRNGGPALVTARGLDSTQFPYAGCIPLLYRARGLKLRYVLGGGHLIKKAEQILGRSLQ